MAEVFATFNHNGNASLPNQLNLDDKVLLQLNLSGESVPVSAAIACESDFKFPSLLDAQDWINLE